MKERNNLYLILTYKSLLNMRDITVIPSKIFILLVPPLIAMLPEYDTKFRIVELFKLSQSGTQIFIILPSL